LPGLAQHVHFALLLTLLTGLSTGFGSLLGLFNRSFNPSLLALSLSFSAGVMIQVSFLEIFPKARTTLSAALGVRAGYVWTTIAFFAGIALMAAIDQVLPSHGDAAQLGLRPSQSANAEERNALLRMGLFSALAIAIHNFPEGLATFMAAVSNPRFGFSIALAPGTYSFNITLTFKQGLQPFKVLFGKTTFVCRIYFVGSIAVLAYAIFNVVQGN